jgi:hypothetical protein
MKQMQAQFVIPESKHKLALGDLKELVKRTSRLMWVSTKDVLEAPHLADAMDAFGWPVKHDADGNITSIHFAREKAGDDKLFFEAIAEFVDDGSFIEMCGEDGSRWRWIFSGGQVAEKNAVVSWG